MIKRTRLSWIPPVSRRARIACLALTLVATGAVMSPAEAAQAGQVATIVIRSGDQGDGDRTARIVADPAAIVDWRERHVSYQDAGVIGPEQAIATARERGLEPGRAPWRVFLLIDPALNVPVWRVMNTALEDGARTEGRTVTIEASKGQVVSVTDWWSRIG